MGGPGDEWTKRRVDQKTGEPGDREEFAELVKVLCSSGALGAAKLRPLVTEGGGWTVLAAASEHFWISATGVVPLTVV